MLDFPMTETTFLLPGPAGELEVSTMPGDEQSQRDLVAIICHPHPQHEGTMNNKVVTTLARMFRDLGFKTVRFNFRGVGKSTGEYGDKAGELEDLIAIAHWVKTTCPNAVIYLAGFSFGAYIALRGAEKISCAQLITVALPVKWFDQNEQPIIRCPWILVQGDQDDVVSAKKVYAWIETLKQKPTLIQLEQAGHFFHGQLLELRRRLEETI